MTRREGWRFLARAIPAWPVMGALLLVGIASGWIHDHCDRLFWRLARWAEVDQ